MLLEPRNLRGIAARGHACYKPTETVDSVDGQWNGVHDGDDAGDHEDDGRVLPGLEQTAVHGELGSCLRGFEIHFVVSLSDLVCVLVTHVDCEDLLVGHAVDSLDPLNGRRVQSLDHGAHVSDGHPCNQLPLQ